MAPALAPPSFGLQAPLCQRLAPESESIEPLR
jgi:hypothetical protein